MPVASRTWAKYSTLTLIVDMALFSILGALFIAIKIHLCIHME
jgi:hypothetical protein